MPSKIVINEELVSYLYNSGRKTDFILKSFNISKPTLRRIIKRNNATKGSVYSLNENSFGVFTKESCYWAGFCAADAWIGERGRRKIRLELQYKDHSHIKKFCKFLEREKESIRIQKRYRFGKFFYSTILEVGNDQIVSDLVNNFNVVQNKSLILKPPSKIPDNLIKHYIRGYLDGDGHISKDGRSLICSGSKFLIDWVEFIIKNKVPEVKYARDKKSVYIIRFNKYSSRCFLEWLYDESDHYTRMDRKYKRFLRYTKENLLKSDKII